MTASNAKSQELRETAAAWCDRMAGENVTRETRAAFVHWLEESPQHRTAYAAVTRAWRQVQASSCEPRILELRHEAVRRAALGPPRGVGLRAMLGATVLMIAALLALVQLSSIGPEASFESGETRFVTRVGERRAIDLEDGSTVTLNTGSELISLYDAKERRVVLTRGQAFFEVAKHDARPFVVESQGRRIVAVGTAFEVRLYDQNIKVTMLEGVVRVEQAEDTPHPVATLSAGEQLTLGAGRFDRVRLADPQRLVSWRDGQMIFESSRLADAVAEVNRYSQQQVKLATPALGDLLISGAFATGNPAVFVDALTAYFNIRVVYRDETTILLGTTNGLQHASAGPGTGETGN